MKQFRVCLLAAGVTSLALAVSVCAQPTVIDDLLRREVKFEPKSALPLDEHLIGLARAADINFLADATSFPPDARVTPYPGTLSSIAGVRGPGAAIWRPTLLNLIGDVADQKALSQLRFDDRTFLLWSEPDIVALGRLVAAEMNAHPVEPPARLTLDKLSKYFREVHGWNGQAQDVDFKVPIAALPLELRAGVLAETRAVLLNRLAGRRRNVQTTTNPDGEEQTKVNEETTLVPSPTLWFDDDFWSKARLKIIVVEQTVNGRKGMWPCLFVSGAAPQGGGPGLSTIVGRLEALAGGQRQGRLRASTIQLARFDAAPPNAAPPAAAPAIGIANAQGDAGRRGTAISGLAAAELERDPALAAKASFAAKRQPLPALLADLQKRSGVRLALAGDFPAANARITARVREMPLSRLMIALSRLYGCEWSKVGESYTLRNGGQSELERTLLQIGDPLSYRYRFHLAPEWEAWKQHNAALSNEVLDHVEVDALRSRDGVALSSLPADLQERLRHRVREDRAEFLLGDYLRERSALGQTLYLHFGITPEDIRGVDGVGVLVNRAEKRPELTIRTANGKLVAYVFPGA